MTSTVLVIDHGAYAVKHGLSSASSPCVTPNAAVRDKTARRTLFGDQVATQAQAQAAAVTRTFDRGYCVNWPLQLQVFEHCGALARQLASSHVLLSEPLFAPRATRIAMGEVFFEHYGVASLHTAPAQLWASVARRARSVEPDEACVRTRAAVVVDVGYSCTWIAPIYDQRVINYAARRVDVGGKALTNYLKEQLSLRHFNMMDETQLVNHIRETVCFVDASFEATMRRAARGDVAALRCQYVLPNYVDRHVGFVRGGAGDDARLLTDDDQVLTLANERICVPELLLRPSDVGFAHAGIAEAIVQAIAAAPPALAPALYATIELVGGCALTPGLLERVRADVRALAPADVAVNVDVAPDPIAAAWHGGAALAQQPQIEKLRVTRAQYLERGGNSLIDTKLIASQ
jgi:actin-related protein 6